MLIPARSIQGPEYGSSFKLR